MARSSHNCIQNRRGFRTALLLLERAAATLFLSIAAIQPPAGAAPQIDPRSLARIESHLEDGDVVSGSGFVVPDGYVVTAYHVIRNSRRIDLVFGTRPPLKDVEVVAVRPDADIALLRAPSAGLKPYSVGSPAPVAGMNVYVHGLPLGFENQLLTGQLTQSGYMASKMWSDRTNRPIFAVKELDLIPIDITAEGGMSGGPVVDEHGTAFGVFSGSIDAGGRGYAWAVPLANARIEQMQRIDAPASAIHNWPVFNFLRGDLSMLRSFNPNSQAARIANGCRRQVDVMQTGQQKQLEAAEAFHVSYLSVQPNIDAVVMNHGEDPRNRYSRMKMLMATLQPQIEAAPKLQQEWTTTVSAAMTACFSETVLQNVLPPDIPSTRANVLYDTRVAKRFNYLMGDVQRLQATSQSITSKGQAQGARIVELASSMPQLDFEHQLLATREYLSLMDQSSLDALSQESAAYFASFYRLTRSWSELFEALERYNWDGVYSETEYEDPSGITIAAGGGWIAVDEEVRKTLLAPSMPDDVKFIRYNIRGGNLAAVAEFAFTPDESGPYPTPESQIPGLQKFLDEYWTGLQQRDQAKFSNRQVNHRRVNGALLFETTGDAVAGGTKYRIYIANRELPKGSVSINCFLLSPDLQFDVCGGLVDGVRLAK